jgi:hypothetical protein
MGMENNNIYDFAKNLIGKAGIKASMGYGLKLDLKNKEISKTPYLKLQIVDFDKIDAGLFVTAKQDLGFGVGVKIKKTSLKIDLGVCIGLSDTIKLKNIKPAFFMGFNLAF